MVTRRCWHSSWRMETTLVQHSDDEGEEGDEDGVDDTCEQLRQDRTGRREEEEKRARE